MKEEKPRTIDELICHSTSKNESRAFCVQPSSQKTLDSNGRIRKCYFHNRFSDVDIMFSNTLPDLETAKQYYEIAFDTYAVAMFHPVNRSQIYAGIRR